jgi:hypothetical protein
MGKGLAKQFKEKYPAMFLEYSQVCKDGLLEPGTLHIFEVSEKLTIINFPTKIHWKNSSKIEYIEKGLVSLREYLITSSLKGYLELNPSKSISIPALGCQNGGLKYDLVKNLIITILDDLVNDIRVFEPRE